MEQGSSPGLHHLLGEMEQILTRERSALAKLDREQIAFAADEKVRLDEAIRQAAALSPPKGENAQLLSRISKQARDNQILLAHARSCVQGIIQLVSGHNIPQHPGVQSRVAPRPVALNIKT